MEEKWKSVRGYEGLYEVSSDGRVKNSKTGRILTPRVNNSGYVRISLYKKEGCKEFLVHRLVAETFIPAVNGKEIVNHIDENKLNNNVENLEWVTSQENVQHSIERLRVPKKHKVIYLYTLYGRLVRVFSSAVEAGNYFGVSTTTIISAINNKSKFNTLYYLGTPDIIPDFEELVGLVDYLEDYRTAKQLKKDVFAKALETTRTNYMIWLQKQKVPYKELKKVASLLNMTIDRAWDLNEVYT
ncbi:NUMOD4 domain-containing protein [Streptococcus respiraculi]|uniref:NUMOD4 domain-containing protein n=1 Tax=Streptococcus respiraculi TaxID=2021971 RepID=UPI000E73624B|nr:NUMOD4 domain-containing protein [Streptococcus respiraculi]